MQKVLVTGGTGVVGAPIVSGLVARGVQVRCLVRDRSSAEGLLPPQAELVVGEIESGNDLVRATAGCDAVFHVAGIVEQWTRDRDVFRRVNLEGTRNALKAARVTGVDRFVYVSTQDTFDLTRDPFDETMPSHDRNPSAYEASKIAAQELVDEAGREGLSVCSVHPCAVFGPGAARATGLTALIVGLRQGKIPQLLNGGLAVVFNADVAVGAIAAAEQRVSGVKYIFAESYRTLKEIAEAVHQLHPPAAVPRVLPLWAAQFIARVGEPLAKVTGRPPILARDTLGVLMRTGRPSAAKAERELGWTPTPFFEGIQRTLASFAPARNPVAARAP